MPKTVKRAAPPPEIPPANTKADRRQLILQSLRGRDIEQAIADPKLWAAIKDEAESDDPDKLVTKEAVRLVEDTRRKQSKDRSLSLFFSSDDALIIPGFLGSELDDVKGSDGVIWIDPLLLTGDPSRLVKLNKLKLKPYESGKADEDEAEGVEIRPNGAMPLVYGVLKYVLNVSRYSALIFGVDWRKDLEESALALAAVIRARADQRFRPLHVIAHSQGAVVARRALQLLGADLARQLVKNLVLLGPATAGTFSAVTALTGNHSFLEMARRWGIVPPDKFDQTIQSMSGIYQLIPWRTKAVGRTPADLSTAKPLEWIAANREAMKTASFWPQKIEQARLDAFLGWSEKIDTSFFNDRTSIILGDQPTVGGVMSQGGQLVPNPMFDTTGDGTVPDALALIDGVSRVYKAAGTEHMMLPASTAVIAAVRDILADRTPQVETFGGLAATATATPFPVLVTPPPTPISSPPVETRKTAEALTAEAAKTPKEEASDRSVSKRNRDDIFASRQAGDVAPPPFRSLRVFSFDPLMATEIESLGTDQITLDLPWDFADGNQLQPGPVGDYVEVIDCDPASGCVYPPIDLNHPHVLAQGGLPASEGDPRFHQQMVYAVAMNTIRQFELALGRKALWSIRLERDEKGRVKSPPADMPFEQQAEREFVQRLRIYPHAMRQANAYYHPEKKALLFGYFPAAGGDDDRNIPGATVFTCLSHDVIAHETTHALLDGMHRYFVEPSNPDVFAFHEAFADVVALFQHFSHRDVLISQLSQAHGVLTNESKLGILAAQFGEATGHGGALRQYLARFDKALKSWTPVTPDRKSIRTETEPHARGAILVAALFRGFTNIYENRVKDLRRIATGGNGLLPEGGDLHPDLVARMADEAAKAARHMLNMCIRALDYVPPVDVTFGDFLRAMITADYDLVRDDDRRYRVSVLSAFRDWGIYPRDVRSLSVDNLLWSEPSIGAHPDLSKFLEENPKVHADDWDLSTDRRRAYERMKWNAWACHNWLAGYTLRDKTNPAGPMAVVVSSPMKEWIDRVESLGIVLSPYTQDQSGNDVMTTGTIRRDQDGYPVFEVHSFRPCRRIGPDGQQRTEFVVEIVQKRKGFHDPDVQKAMDRGTISYDSHDEPDFWFRGGCTLLIGNTDGRIRYCIKKRVCDDERLRRESAFRLGTDDGLAGAYLDGGHGNPFALLHGEG